MTNDPAERHAPDYRTGIGYDVHAFAEGRKLFLGGIEIPYERGLAGHSDADVVLHAICDAMLGAMGQGDIGEHFPDSDERYKGISSSKLLKQVNELAVAEGFTVRNVDVVVIAEEPNLKEYKKKMAFHIAYELALDECRVNIKATTQEGLGFAGRKEGVAAMATVLVGRGL